MCVSVSVCVRFFSRFSRFKHGVFALSDFSLTLNYCLPFPFVYFYNMYIAKNVRVCFLFGCFCLFAFFVFFSHFNKEAVFLRVFV